MGSAFDWKSYEWTLVLFASVLLLLGMVLPFSDGTVINNYNVTNQTIVNITGGNVTSVGLSSNNSAVLIYGSPITTNGTFDLLIKNSTTTQDGLMTATQVTALTLKALAGNCPGQFVQNATTAGVQCWTPTDQVGSGNITGAITQGYVPYAVNGSHLGNSVIYNNITAIDIAGQFEFNTSLPSLAVGTGAYATGTNSFALGIGTRATANECIAMGGAVTGNFCSGRGSVSLGAGNNATGQFSVTIGVTNIASQTFNVAIGHSAKATGSSSLALGGAQAAGSNSVAIGTSTSTNASGQTSVAIGSNSVALGLQSVVFGFASTALGSNCIALGSVKRCTGTDSVSLGGIDVTQPGSVVIGPVNNTAIVSTLIGANPSGTPFYQFFGQFDNVSIGTINTPVEKLYQDSGTATATYHKFTAGTTTGTTASDGLSIGITSAGNAQVRQYENLPLEFWTNNLQRVTVAANGSVGINTTTPGYLFTVQGDGKFTGNINVKNITIGDPYYIYEQSGVLKINNGSADVFSIAGKSVSLLDNVCYTNSSGCAATMPTSGGDVSSRPMCDVSRRGSTWVTFAGLGVSDSVSVCMKSALDTYSWVGI